MRVYSDIRVNGRNLLVGFLIKTFFFCLKPQTRSNFKEFNDFSSVLKPITFTQKPNSEILFTKIRLHLLKDICVIPITVKNFNLIPL